MCSPIIFHSGRLWTTCNILLKFHYFFITCYSLAQYRYLSSCFMCGQFFFFFFHLRLNSLFFLQNHFFSQDLNYRSSIASGNLYFFFRLANGFKLPSPFYRTPFCQHNYFILFFTCVPSQWYFLFHIFFWSSHFVLGLVKIFQLFFGEFLFQMLLKVSTFGSFQSCFGCVHYGRPDCYLIYSNLGFSSQVFVSPTCAT